MHKGRVAARRRPNLSQVRRRIPAPTLRGLIGDAHRRAAGACACCGAALAGSEVVIGIAGTGPVVLTHEECGGGLTVIGTGRYSENGLLVAQAAAR